MSAAQGFRREEPRTAPPLPGERDPSCPTVGGHVMENEACEDTRKVLPMAQRKRRVTV
jgi:hypothetical protein